MRIGDENLFEIGCRKSPCFLSLPYLVHIAHAGVEAPSIGSFNTISTKARVHHTARLTDHCVISERCMLIPAEDEVLDEYTVVYGHSTGPIPDCERRIWSGRGKVQEADLRRKHAEYLREMLPKFNRLRRGEAS